MCQPFRESDPARGYERTETSRELRAALVRLPTDYRIALELRYWNGLSMAEMAGLLSVRVSTVKWRLYAAKQALEEEMSREGA